MLDLQILQRSLLKGLILSLALGVVVLGSMIYNARLWLQDYPKPIQEKVPPLSPAEKRDRVVVVVLALDLFILTLLKPRFAILPGAEGMEYLFNDYRKQLTDFLKGCVFCVVASLPFAVIAIL